ncbi:MAG: acyl carrier protein [Myxococcales bacterium]|nr:acyl carrier protein [Myxococcales bacterium]
MSQSNLKEELRALMAEIVEKDPSEIGDDVRLRELGVDSMQAIEIISEIERRYHIKIAESEFDQVRTLNLASAFLAQKLGQAG